ncbi:MAG: alpha-hydroxy-acid oxidizing protein [Coriobacteriia bacterium]|nr:alpha-hydroxy-acid oxidizing protein [Coriobacteriia bacterium]MBS5477260.1 alpha-hydroxy-acid oxidizing protein [Coriobacteriia bacterium]
MGEANEGAGQSLGERYGALGHEPTSWAEVVAAARPHIGSFCKACPTCDGRACKNAVPGPGAKGVGDVAIRNYAAWSELRVNLDALRPAGVIDTNSELFGLDLTMPLFIGPVGDVNRHYGPALDTLGYNRMSLRAARDFGVAAFTGDGVPDELMGQSCMAIGEVGGVGVPTIKPWSLEKIAAKMELANASGAFAIAMDVDAAGLPFLKGQQPPAGPKSVEELRAIAAMAHAPFIVKGVMTPRSAERACEAGADAIVVSNHGGRVLDGCPATAEVLPSIVRAVDGACRVLVDGGIRTGLDVFRALALGADGVLVCRPFVVAAYGAGEAGISFLLHKMRGELADVMEMCGARSIADIGPDMLWNAPRV